MKSRQRKKIGLRFITLVIYKLDLYTTEIYGDIEERYKENK